jgi:carboxymethylenebutenolidase
MTIDLDVDGRPAAFAAPADATGPVPGVIVVHEILGLNDDIRRITDRFAVAGYAAVAPDLFSGGPKPVCIARAVLDGSRGGHRTTAAIDGVRRWLQARPEVQGQPVGIIGFCIGGGFALTAAVRTDLAVASVNYGAVPDQSLDGVCPVVGSYGAKDRTFRKSADRLERSLTALGVDHDVRVYPGVGHSFLNRHPLMERFLPHDEAVAEQAWANIFDFFASHLGKE